MPSRELRWMIGTYSKKEPNYYVLSECLDDDDDDDDDKEFPLNMTVVLKEKEKWSKSLGTS